MLTTGKLLTTLSGRTVAETQAPDPVTDPLSAFRYVEGRRRVLQDTVRQRPMVRLWDKNFDYIGQIAQEKSVAVEELTAGPGAGTCVIRRDNWLSDFILYDRRAVEDLHITVDPIPTQRTWQRRWGGKVLHTNAKRDSDGLHTVELEMVSNRAHYAHLLAAANPIFAPEVQLPKAYLLPWNIRTGLTLSMWINLARQYFPLVSIPLNLFNPGSWIGTDIRNFHPLSWPVQVQFLNPVADSSRFTVFTSRWQDFESATAQLLTDAGCHVRAYTWLTEDATSPHPELEAMIPGLGLVEEALHERFPQVPTNGTLADLARPTRNAVVLAVVDKSNVTGPTGTLLDGPLRLIAETADDLITETLVPFDKDHDGSTDPLVRKWFGVAPDPPKVVFRDGEYSGIVESQRSMHASTAKTIMVGGRSPAWLNQAISFGIKYGLSELSAVIQAVAGANATFSPEITGYQTPGTPGLEEAYNEQLSDVFMAFQRWTDPKRALQSGTHGFLEEFVQGGSGSAYTVSGELDIRTGLWKTRDYTSFRTTVRNAAPHIVFEDFDLGDLLGFQMGAVIHRDNCTGIRTSWDETNPVLAELLIGDDSDDEDPFAVAMRTLAGLWDSFGSMLIGGEIF